MKRIGVLPHAFKPEARELAAKVAHFLIERGCEPYLLPGDASSLGLGLAERAVDKEAFSTLDLLVVVGGDGTMLHGIELAGFAGVPVLGVNHGYLGFLTEVSADDVFDALERTLAGEHKIDERSTVHGSVRRADGADEEIGEAINEISVERNVGGKIIQMTITIGGQPFTTVAADGLIVATPTGSTAYAFSMRGPVVAPSVRCLDVVAVGAHGLFDRPLVVAPDQVVEIAVRLGGRGIVLADGKPRTEIGEGDVLRAEVGPSVVKLVRLAPDSFFTRLARRFGIPGGPGE